PVTEADETRCRQAQFALIGLLSSLRQVVSHLIALEIDAGDLRNHPTVKLVVGVLAGHESLDVPSLLYLLIVVFEFPFADGDANLSGGYLFVDLFPLFSRKIRLERPLIGPPVEAASGRRQ